MSETLQRGRRGRTTTVAESEVRRRGGAETPRVARRTCSSRRATSPADYLERLLDILDYDGDIDLDVEGGRADGGASSARETSTSWSAPAARSWTRAGADPVGGPAETGVRSRLMLDIGRLPGRPRAELARPRVGARPSRCCAPASRSGWPR